MASEPFIWLYIGVVVYSLFGLIFSDGWFELCRESIQLG